MIIKAAFTVGIFTFISRIVGFLRECVMVFCLGAGIHTDALLIALKLANTFRRIFAEGAFNSSFLPRFSKIIYSKENKALIPSSTNNIIQERNNDRDKHINYEIANTILSEVFTALMVIVILFCGIVLWFFPSILQILVSGFDVLSEKFKLSVTLGRICFPYLILISMASLFAGVLNTINKFALPAAVHSILSLFTMLGLFIGYWFNCSHCLTVYIVSWCVLISGAVQSYILYNAIKKNGFFIKIKCNFWTYHVKDIMKNMIPGIIGTGVWQLNLLVDTTIASYFPTGTITCINLADRLNQFPLGTLGIALSTALLPTLSRHISQANYNEASKELEKGITFALFLTFPAATILLALNEPSVAVAFQRGLFNYENVVITANALSGFAIGLPAYILTKVFSAVYFAFGETKSPVVFGIYTVILNIIFLLVFIPFFKYFGLAFCTSISAISNAIMLIYFCDKKIRINITGNFFPKIFAQLSAATITYFSLTKLAKILWTPDMGTYLIKWLVFALFSISGIITYITFNILILRLLKQPYWKLWQKESWI